MTFTQEDVAQILKIARASEFGLGEGLKHKQGHLRIDQYGSAPNADVLAMCLVNGFDAKYDIISVFSAALQVLESKCISLTPSKSKS